MRFFFTTYYMIGTLYIHGKNSFEMKFIKVIPMMHLLYLTKADSFLARMISSVLEFTSHQWRWFLQS